MSDYLLSIHKVNGGRVNLKPGGVAERNLVAAVIQRLEGESVGFFTSKTQVLAVVEKALNDVLYEVKSDVLP